MVSFLKDESDILTDDYDDDDYIDCKYVGKYSASEIAALIGRHEYRTLAQALYKSLQKHERFKETLIEVKRETKNRNELIVSRYVYKATGELATIIDDVSKSDNCVEIDDYVDRQIAEAMSKMNINSDTETVDIVTRVRKELRSRVNMSRGTKLENVSIDSLELEHGMRISERNSKLYRFQCDHYGLSGRVDGIDVKGECVIEIKNRMKYMNIVPTYDMIQCIMYMKLTGFKKCLLVECFPDKTTRQTLLTWNEHEYEDIHKALCTLVCKVRKMTKNEIRELIKQYDVDCAAE